MYPARREAEGVGRAASATHLHAATTFRKRTSTEAVFAERGVSSAAGLSPCSRRLKEGQRIFLRADVSDLLSRRQWLRKRALTVKAAECAHAIVAAPKVHPCASFLCILVHPS